MSHTLVVESMSYFVSNNVSDATIIKIPEKKKIVANNISNATIVKIPEKSIVSNNVPDATIIKITAGDNRRKNTSPSIIIIVIWSCIRIKGEVSHD